jgi:hypothetical protein
METRGYKLSNFRIYICLLLLSVLIFSCSNSHTAVMDPFLVHYFGGIDLGIRQLDLHRYGSNFTYPNEDDFSFGSPDSNSGLRLTINTPTYFPIWPLPLFSRVEMIVAEFNEINKYVDSDSSVNGLLELFAISLKKTPEHYYIQFPPGEDAIESNIYLWRFSEYSFRVGIYTSNTKNKTKSLKMYAITDTSFSTDIYPEWNFYKISESGDTTKVE